MMNRNPDILFMAEYVKNVLYFATVRHGKQLKSSSDLHYFSIDDELVYENYYSDFGPLNLGCVYKYCKLLNDKLKQHINKQAIVHYTSIDPKKKANSAFLLGCFGVLYLSLTPRDALKPLMAHGQNYRPFQDATQGDPIYTITLTDCLQGIKKARELGFFNFQDFNYEEYDRLDKIQGGDLNWIIPGKFLAFIGPVDYSVSLYHPPEMYVDYFLENNVGIVIRLNKRLYDGNVFSNMGIIHYDLFFPDGSCPPRHILFKFLQISEESDCAIAVHCKAGLGRTGSLIGCYLIKHYGMTSREAIGWMRICRPGSVIGHQQGWLEQLESWLLKQGKLYRMSWHRKYQKLDKMTEIIKVCDRKRTYQNAERMPTHEFGVYSIAEKTRKQRPILFHNKSPSPPPPIQKSARSDITPTVRPQASRGREDVTQLEHAHNEDDEIFLTSCDLTIVPSSPLTRLKGCIIKNHSITEDTEDGIDEETPFWRKYLCCDPCFKTLNDGLWMLAVRCASIAPDNCNSYKLCNILDLVAANKAVEKDSCDCRMKGSNMSSVQRVHRGDQHELSAGSRRSGAGDPRATRTSKVPISRLPFQKNNPKPNDSAPRSPNMTNLLAKFRTSQVPIIKNVNDAKNFLLKSSLNDREKQLNSALTVTPQYRAQNNYGTAVCDDTRSAYPSTNKSSNQPQNRRRLGRSPSPPQSRLPKEQSRATNTPPSSERYLRKDSSKSALRDALSRLKFSMVRDTSIGAASFGAASLGARRDAPAPRRAPSVRSDERPLATQGDMLNSIKFQRRLRDTIISEKGSLFQDKISLTAKDKCNRKVASPRVNPLSKAIAPDISQTAKDKSVKKSASSRPSSPTKVPSPDMSTKDKSSVSSRQLFGPIRPMSPKGRRTPNSSFY